MITVGYTKLGKVKAFKIFNTNFYNI